MAGLKRLAKEIKALRAKPPDGVSLHSADDARCWLVNLEGAPDTLYAGEQYQLQFVFGDDHPWGLRGYVRRDGVHHHIYSNVRSHHDLKICCQVEPSLTRSVLV